MNRSPSARFTLGVAGACLFAAIAGSPVMAQDKAGTPAKDERGRKLFVENDKVRVTENSYAPGATSGMLERSTRVVRALTDGTVEKTMPDGKKETITWKAGDVKFLPKETYSQKNIGKTELVLFTVTVK
jgi:hypothetical protein